MALLPPITVFDVETTGLDPRKGHRIIEIAGIRIQDGTIDESRTFVSLVNPERQIPWDAKQVNKIDDADVAAAPTIDQVLPRFLAFAEGSVLVAHNASFDASFLQNEKEMCWGYVELPEVFCSLRLSQSLYPRDFRHNLDAISRKFQLTLPSDRHRALADCVLLSQALLRMFQDGNIRSMEDLRKRASLGQLVS